MNLEEKWKLAGDYEVNFLCNDDPDLKALAIEYNNAISPEARKLHDESIIIDMCSFYLHEYNWQLEQSKATAMNFTIGDVYCPDSSQMLRAITGMHSSVHRSPNHLMMINTVDDIYEAKKTGKTGIIFGAQHCDFIFHSDIEASTEVFSMLGLRVMQIAYNHRTFAADGCASGSDAGITNHGKMLIRAMERNGVTLDLSHAGRRSALEAIEFAEKPMIYSHQNPTALFPHVRNIDDEPLKKCAERGGVVCVTAYAPLLYDGKNLPSVEKFVDAVEHYADILGIDHIGVGLDSNGQAGCYDRDHAINLNKFHRSYYEKYGSPYIAGIDAGRGKASVCVDGIISTANLPNITYHLLKRGFSESDVKKIMGENMLRIFKETWK
jgi:membrane dipeptidase